MNYQAHLDYDWYPRALPANVIIGDGSWLHSAYALLHFYSRCPNGLQIGRHTGIYVETFFNIGPDGEVKIGNYCTLAGPIISTNQRVTIGDYVLISREVIIADRYDAQPIGDTLPLEPNRNGSRRDIVVGNDAWIGTRALLLCGAKIGSGAIVGAGAVVDFEVPDYAIVAGSPARIVGWSKPNETRPGPLMAGVGS